MNRPLSISTRPTIALLTDFGLADSYVGVMKGVIVGIEPNVQLIDITHEIAPQDVSSGAWVLATSYRYFPKGTAFVCVVDPGVGSSRRAIAVYAGDWFFVGPDNGLFSYVYAEQEIKQVVRLENRKYQLPLTSATFHGRDMFAPAGAYLAQGVALSEFGAMVDPAILQRLEIGQPLRRGTSIEGQIVHVDHFGNLITTIPLTMVPQLFTDIQIQLRFASKMIVVTQRRQFFADRRQSEQEQPFLYGDSSGYVGIAVRNGSAAGILGVGYGEVVRLDSGEGEVV